MSLMIRRDPTIKTKDVWVVQIEKFINDDLCQIFDTHMINQSGHTIWFDSHHRIHREYGPAVESGNDIPIHRNFRWYLHGQNFLNINDWLRHTPITDEEKVLLKLRYA